MKKHPVSLWYFVKEGISNLFVHGFMSFAAVTVMAACLLITGCFALVAYNIGIIIEKLESQNEIAVFIEDTLTREEAMEIESKIKENPNIATVEFIPKEQAFENYLVELGEDAYIMEGLKADNPLRDGYKITMHDIGQHAQTVKDISEIPGIGSTQSRKDISDKLLKIKSIVNSISATLVALLGAVSLFIISNTVRLALFYRRDEIAIMKMVGATNAFIRMPFVVEGIVLGLMGGILAYGAQYGVYSYIAKQMVASTGIFDVVAFSTFALPLLGVLLVGGMVIGLIGSIFTIQKFLKV